MKKFIYVCAVVALSAATLSATPDAVTAGAEKAIKKGNPQYFRALAQLGALNPAMLLSAETKARLLEQAQKEVATQKGNQGLPTWSTLGKLELTLAVSATMWLLAKAWQTANFTPKAAKDANGERTLSEKLDAAAEWAMIASNGMLAATETYKWWTTVTKKKESLRNAEKTMSAIEKLPTSDMIGQIRY